MLLGRTSVGVFFHIPKVPPMFLPLIGITLGSLALLKLGALVVWVTILALALKLAVAVIFLLAGLLGWKHVNRK